ncbi:MAG: CapA family protein [Actinomycetota bacterium]|nr:CapA family protein [Actinomycetota bacterium]
MRRRQTRAVIVWVAAAGLAAGCTASTSPDADPARPGTSAAASPTGTGGPAPTSPANNEPTSTEQTESPEPRTFTVVMSGDMLLHEGLWETAQDDAQRTGRGEMDFRPLLGHMRSVTAGADLAVCHMETPLAARGGPYQGYPVFSAPPAIVPALEWAGYDACTTASNHSIDQGFEGLTRTLDYFDTAGIAHAGTFATREASREPLLLDVAGAKVALISATYGTNGIPLPAEQPWSVPLMKVAKIKQLAARAKAQGADVVMVALHWGLEYMHEPTSDQLAIARQLTLSPDIDFIYGHHAHVVQPYDKINGTWVAFGLGNAVAQQETDIEGVYDGTTCRVTFTERPDGTFVVKRLEYIPTMITRYDGGINPMRVLNVSRALDDSRYTDLRGQLRATERRVSAVIDQRGAFEKGVTQGE